MSTRLESNQPAQNNSNNHTLNQPYAEVSGYSRTEEWINSITHGIGFIMAIVGLVALIIEAQGVLQVSAVALYGGSLILMFLSSTIYHAVTHHQVKGWLKLLDHSAIYILIAGTYTPLMLITLEGSIGVLGAVLVWSLAVAGVSFKLVFKQKHPKLSLGTYLIMGWMAVAFIVPLLQRFVTEGFILLLIGGVLFSIGAVFYAMKHKPYTHAIWHLFVIGGCTSHYFSIYHYVL